MTPYSCWKASWLKGRRPPFSSDRGAPSRFAPRSSCSPSCNSWKKSCPPLSPPFHHHFNPSPKAGRNNAHPSHTPSIIREPLLQPLEESLPEPHTLLQPSLQPSCNTQPRLSRPSHAPSTIASNLRRLPEELLADPHRPIHHLFNLLQQLDKAFPPLKRTFHHRFNPPTIARASNARPSHTPSS